MVEYLERKSAADRAGKGPIVVGNASLETFRKPMPGEKLVGKLVLSPEEFFSLDIKLFCQLVMNYVEKFAGKDGRGQYLNWAGIVHTNTPDPHIHLLIHGKDSRGTDLFLPPELVKRLPEIATEIQNLVTGGALLTQDILNERKSAEKSRPMPKMGSESLDDRIARIAEGCTWDEFLRSVKMYRKKAAHARMVHLEQLGLLKIDSDHKIRLANDFLNVSKQMFGHLARIESTGCVRYSRAETLSLLVPNSRPVTGMITAVVRDPQLGRTYAIVETLKGTPHVLPIDAKDLQIFAEWQRKRFLVKVRKGKIIRENIAPRDLVAKLRSSGKLTKAILATEAIELQHYELPLLQSEALRTLPVNDFSL